MNQKRRFYTEAAYLLGLVILAFGTALMEKADFGMSMVVAPAYLFHLKLSQYFSGFSFGMAEYCLQAVLLVLTVVICRRFRPMYLFSFATAVLYGCILDLMISLVAPVSADGFAVRAVFYVVGMLAGSVGVSLLFHTYLAPEAYELIVKEISQTYKTEIGRTKTVYDCISCALSVVLSFAFFGLWHFEGVKLGTVICALVNGPVIGRLSALEDKCFSFEDAFPLRRFFE